MKDQGQELENAMETQKEVVEEPLLEDELLRDEIVGARRKDCLMGGCGRAGPRRRQRCRILLTLIRGAS